MSYIKPQRYVSFNDLFDLISKDLENALTGLGNVYNTQNFPPLNVLINPNTKDVIFRFALAGFKENDVELNWDGDYLLLTLNAPSAEKEEGFVYAYKGIKSVEKSTRRYLVPLSKYEQSETEASFKDGILEVKVPAKKEMARRKVDIKKVD